MGEFQSTEFIRCPKCSELTETVRADVNICGDNSGDARAECEVCKYRFDIRVLIFYYSPPLKEFENE